MAEPTYLASLQHNIRARPIPWEGAVRAGTLTAAQLTRIRAVDRVRREQRRAVVDDDAAAYAALFVGRQGVLQAAGARVELLQYLLVLLADLLDGEDHARI
jgi:V-type H+-transporting ATPase subunit H